MMFHQTVCQSCASPIRKDAEKGKERNGDFSELYCRRCYQSGMFTDPEITVDEMHETVRVKMLEMKFPRLLADGLADRVQTLKRWEKSEVLSPVI